jgi:RNA polymerase sigma-70 factor (ECF subfamily)
VTNEVDLVERMLAGEQSAFDCFFNGHAARLASFASRRCALDSAALEDVVQQTMINAIRNLDRFRGESTLFTWLCQICRNVLADIRRKASRQPIVDSLESIAAGGSAAMPVQLIDYRDPLDACSADSHRGDIRSTVNELPPRYARILELKYGDELPIDEIARILGLSESAAQSLLARARRSFGESWSARHAGNHVDSPFRANTETR